MATVHVVLANVQARSATGGTLPVMDSVPIGADTFTTSAVSALCTLTGSPGCMWSVTARDGDVWLKFGTGTPVAASEAGWLLLAGGCVEVAVTTAGEKLAIRDF